MEVKTDLLFPLEEFKKENGRAKPFLKWAGGKSQLLDDIQRRLPLDLQDTYTTRYVEPFIGGGAVFFYLVHSYDFKHILVMDINEDLVMAYKCIQERVEDLITHLLAMETEFKRLTNVVQHDYYYKIRDAFNQNKGGFDYIASGAHWVERTAQLLFLNKTCFNGLYRVNAKGGFNVPFGKYKNPTICPTENLRLVSKLLKKVEIRCGDFECCEPFVDASTFVYFDPPYRPLNKTANFNSYAASVFDDGSQLRLAALFRRLDAKDAKLMLSNSDPRNENPEDNFFDDAYNGFSIERVKANRMINCNATRRGEIKELIITNY
ncbi:MAG TPA: DNA adenine methylase [Candidatus Hydrogenedentes bacterium]|nr:DNA adenine methylase [Candidatus Hydrogenedentota bacterium]